MLNRKDRKDRKGLLYAASSYIFATFALSAVNNQPALYSKEQNY